MDTGVEVPIDPSAVWARIQTVIDRDKLMAAVATVEELAPDSVDDDEVSGQRQELIKRYATVRPFVSMLSAVVPMGSTDAGRPVLLAAQGVADLLGRKRLRRSDIIDAVVVGSWRRFEFTVDPTPPGGELVDLRAYVLCVLDALHRVLNAVVLWNTRYIDAALQALRDQGYPVADEDAARLLPLIDAHLNVHGRYTFTQPADNGLRPLRDLTEPVEEEYLPDGTSPMSL